MSCIFTVDVEDWFHILDVPSVPPLAAWEGLPSRVERNARRLLDLFDGAGTRVTCFFLGWVAERFPGLVREAAARGHEVASHGYAHQLVYQQTAREFRDDIRRAKHILENLVGRPVAGYRAPGFSVYHETPWFFEELAAAGHRYDSSVFPAPHGHGGMKTDQLGPHVVETPAGPVREFPISVGRLLGGRACCFGGGYLRLSPYWLTRRMTYQVLAEGRPVVFYVHPREIDPDHPRLPMTWTRRFKTYVNLRTTEAKVRRILSEFRPISFAEYLSRPPTDLESSRCPLPGRPHFSTTMPANSTPSTARETPSSTAS